ncbi:MAG: hypothetical protein JW943_07105 [Deltaproteobacteria bacterium]|nr:hypothetical protein [Deltaproteobacteria bacterium]
MIWGISPVSYATLAWYSAYGQILVGLFFLLFFYELIKVQKGAFAFSPPVALRWSAYLLLMAASYGSGLALACLAPIAIVMILWENESKLKIAASMFPVIILILLLYIFRDTFYNFFGGDVQQAQLVASGIALTYYRHMLEMLIRMAAYSIYCAGAFPLLFVTSMTTFPPAAFFISLPVGMLFTVLFLRSKGNRFRFYAVLSILFLGLIGLTAYGRAFYYLMFNIPISIGSITPRYYYVILIIVIVTIILMAHELLNNYPKISKIAVIFTCILIACSIYPSIRTAKTIDPANESARERKLYDDTVSDIKKTIRDYPEGTSVFIDNTMHDRFLLIFLSPVDFPGKAAIFSITYPTNTVEGRRVYFVERDCHVADQNIEKKRWRISSLIVSACKFAKKGD